MTQHHEPVAIDSLAAEIDARLQALPNPTTEPVRAVRREYSRRIAGASPQEVIALALRLLDRHRFVAYELVCHHRTALRSLGERELELFGRDMASWEAVDTFACYLAGPAWRERQVPDALIEGWAHSADRWWRRAALVCTVPLNLTARGGRGDTARTLLICRLLIADRDDMVVKAMSWALRQLCTRDPQAVRDFLAEYNGRLAARVVREVQNKLTTGLKNPRNKPITKQ
ncbi:MAG TPA: DNA alkylation repair protein [Ktedonobacteraceae bacterium]|nr:DNA alkylation repair protein [Ktedonobacteraceae bacterium]